MTDLHPLEIFISIISCIEVLVVVLSSLVYKPVPSKSGSRGKLNNKMRDFFCMSNLPEQRWRYSSLSAGHASHALLALQPWKQLLTFLR